MRVTVFLMLVSFAATPAAAQITFTSTPPATGSQANAVPGDGKIICERQDEVGSRLGGKKVCKTKSQWDEERRMQRENVEKEQQMITGTGHSG